MATERILLLYDKETMLQKMIAESNIWKIPILNVDSVAYLSFGSLDTAETDAVCAVHYQPQTMLTLLNQSRAKFPTAGIVLLTSEHLTGPTRGLLLFSGADACFDDAASLVEIFAAIQALRRRGHAFLRETLASKGREPTDTDKIESTVGQWRLHNDGWSLLTPRGNSIAMTRSERHIMQKLFDHSPKVVGREDLFDERDMSDRNIALLISRMKRKTKLMGEDLPVRAIRGQGYVFLGASRSQR